MTDCKLTDVEIHEIDNGWEVVSETTNECKYFDDIKKAKTYAKKIIDAAKKMDDD